jgi:hypothetical protein
VAITQEQFSENYKSMLESHDNRVKAIVEAKNNAREFTRIMGGNYECNAQNINVITMPNERSRYFSDDELIEMTTKEN